jgi:FkbM family methyltransferase
VKATLGRGANRVLSPLGLELVRRGGTGSRRSTFLGALQQTAALGSQPRTVIDVGAAYGDWTRACKAVFPSATFLMVEPLEEFAPFLKRVAADLPSVSWVSAAAAREAGSGELRVHADLVGSSLLVETLESTDVEPRPVRITTVDALVREHDASPPFLLKVDVQGNELDVLAGATETLADASLVILEVSFFPFLVGGPQFDEVVAFMRAAGFMTYDVFDLSYRPLDGALAQADLMFVPIGSPLRSEHAWDSESEQSVDEHARRNAFERRRKSL